MQCYPGITAQTWYYTNDNYIAVQNQGQCLDLTSESVRGKDHSGLPLTCRCRREHQRREHCADMGGERYVDIPTSLAPTPLAFFTSLTFPTFSYFSYNPPHHYTFCGREPLAPHTAQLIPIPSEPSAYAVPQCSSNNNNQHWMLTSS
jgi:hypothetical protein